MRLLASTFLLLLSFLAYLPAVASAQEESAAAVNELVTGDEYTIRVERHGASESYIGNLLLATPDWIVIQQEESGPHAGVPRSQLPFFTRSFKNVGIGREVYIVWLPRDAATIMQRVMPHAYEPLPKVDGTEPPSDSFCHVDYAEAGEMKTLKGTLAHEAGTDLTIRSEMAVAEQRSIPLLGDIPLVGRAFTRQILIAQHREQKLAREDVLAVHIKTK